MGLVVLQRRNMPTSISLRRLLRCLLAILFAAATTTYTVLWVEAVRQAPRQPGFGSYAYSAATHSMLVGAVVPGSPAEKAGLQTGDRIVAIDGNPVDDLRPFYNAIVVGQKDVIDFAVERPSAPGGRRTLELALRGSRPAPMCMTRLERLLSLPIGHSLSSLSASRFCFYVLMIHTRGFWRCFLAVFSQADHCLRPRFHRTSEDLQSPTKL
jgi:hypothetical protein